MNINIKNAALELEPHYIASRYPGDSMNTAPSDTYNAGDAKKLQDKAKALLQYIEEEKQEWDKNVTAKKGTSP